VVRSSKRHPDDFNDKQEQHQTKMKLDSKIIAGLPAKTARDLMRHLDVTRVDAEEVLEFLKDEHWRNTVDAACKANPRTPKTLRKREYAEDRKDCAKTWKFKFTPVKMAEAKRVFAALLADGYLEPNEPEHKSDTAKYQASTKGRQLAAANLTKRFNRAKAEAEVADLIERANTINANDELVGYVRKITVFGSYLTDSDDLGDIDLVVEIQPRRHPHTDESRYRAKNSGKSNRYDFFVGINYGHNEVLKLLRARKARLSFNVGSTLELETQFKTLFEWSPGPKRCAQMKAFDWLLHEPLRQVREWLVTNPGINTDPIEVARWCQHVAELLKGKGRHGRLFHDWSDNAAYELLQYWGVSSSEAAAELAHRKIWKDYLERISFWIDSGYKKPISALIEAEIYTHFTRDTDDIDAAILIAKHFRWELIGDRKGWVGPVERRIEEITERD
jgi:hypothetical protein